MKNTSVPILPARKTLQGEALLEALRNLRFLLSRENKARFIVARPTLSEFKQQLLPDHLRTIVKKRTGSRIIVRASRHPRIPPIVRARWPEDQLVENTLPSLACVVRGMADLRIADYVITCQTGDFIFYPAGIAAADGRTPHFEGDPSGRHCSLLWIYPGRVNRKGLECYICHSLEHTHSSCDHSWCTDRLLAELFQGIQEKGQKPDHQESIFHLLSAMLFLLQHEINTEKAVFSSFCLPPEKMDEPGDDPIQQACAYINTHLDSNLTIDIVAKHACISPSVFTRRFKEQTGQTFNQYCTEVRIKHAATLLTKTGLRITGVSQLVGLTDCQFRLLARRHWGCSPREYRLRNN